MYSIQDPGTNRLIHEAMVSDEMRRNGSRPERETVRPGPGLGDGIRAAIGKTLIALGTRIEPARARRPLEAGAPR